MKLFWCFISFLAILAYEVFCSKVRYDGDQVLIITPKTSKHAQYLQELVKEWKLDLWKPDLVEEILVSREIHIHVPFSRKEQMKENLLKQGMTFKIMINDIQELIDKNAASQQNQQERSLSDYNYTRYHPMGEIYGWMEDIHEKHSDLVSKHYMGSTYEERPIYYLKIGWPSKKQKKIIFMDCGMHAREWVSVAYCQWFVKELISNHKHDSELNKVLKQVDFYVVPVLNVDGYVYTWTTERLWRKNRSVHDNGTCYGVDLNRNFDAQWCTVGTDPYCSSLVYCGPSPASELETKAMVTLIEKHKTEILCYLNMHSYSQLILYPYGYSSNISANNEELEKVATIAIERIMEKHKTEYAQGRASYILYFLSGASADWALDINIKLSFIFELRDDGTYGFELPPDQIEPTCEETMTAVMSIVEYIDEHYLDDYIEDNAIMTTVSSRLNLFLSLAFYIFYFVFCV